MIEVEAKIQVQDHSPIRTALFRASAVKIGSFIQRDVYFNAPHRDFAITDEALRIRYTGDKTVVTYKGPKRTDSSIKSRLEVNIEIDSGITFEHLLGNLGFERVMEVKKRREEYAYRGTSIALDEVEGLGTFVEIEVATDADPHEAEELVEAVRKDLGIQGPHITDSYLELLLSKRQ